MSKKRFSAHHGLVPVMLMQGHRGLNPGERAGFEPAMAAALVKAKAAVYVAQDDKGEWRTSDKPAPSVSERGPVDEGAPRNMQEVLIRK